MGSGDGYVRAALLVTVYAAMNMGHLAFKGQQCPPKKKKEKKRRRTAG